MAGEKNPSANKNKSCGSLTAMGRGYMREISVAVISITSDMQMTPPLWQKVKRNYKAS